MAPFRTAFNGYAVKFSPFEEGRVAVATAQNFGIIGNGRQYVLQVGTLTHWSSELILDLLRCCVKGCNSF